MIQYQPVLQKVPAGDSVPESSGVCKRALLHSHSVEALVGQSESKGEQK